MAEIYGNRRSCMRQIKIVADSSADILSLEYEEWEDRIHDLEEQIREIEESIENLE
jgi:hypothetical protein